MASSLLKKLGLMTAAATLALAAANAVPDYEIHLLMDPSKVLGSDKKLLPTVLSTFAMPTSVTKMNVQYLDTNAQDIYNQLWSPRIRNMENEGGLELTYKKRFPVTGTDIDGALTTANQQGFDASDDNYEAQVEWGYSKLTLSFSLGKDVSANGLGDTDLPKTKDSVNMLVDDAPGKFEDWSYDGWGVDKLEASRIYGPVLAKRSTGTWNGFKLYIEVWPIKSGSSTTYIVEASFKTGDRATASSQKSNLQSFLTSKGWFLAQDSLKTSLIMSNY